MNLTIELWLMKNILTQLKQCRSYMFETMFFNVHLLIDDCAYESVSFKTHRHVERALDDIVAAK